MPSDVLTGWLSAGGRVIAPPGPRSAVACSIRSSLTRECASVTGLCIRGRARSKAKWTGRPTQTGREKIPQRRCRAISLAAMRAAMDRLERFVTRRRRLVLGVWIVLVVAAVPFAAQQTKHLTAGGFEVPGSGSQAVSEALKRFPGVQTEPLDPRLRQLARRTPRPWRPRSTRPRRRSRGSRTWPWTRRPRRRPRPPATSRSCCMSLERHRRRRLRGRCGGRPAQEPPHPGQRQPGAARPPRRPAGAVGGNAGRLQEGPREGRVRRLPGRLHHPARRLRLAGRRAAAVQPRGGGRRAHGRGGLLPLPGAADVDLRDQHRVDARHRRGRRLLALHPLALPGGAAPRRRSRNGPRDRDADVGPGRVRVGRDRRHLAGRAVPDRLQDDALDGDRRDRRRGHRGARGDDAAARAHQDARGSRLRAGPRRELGARQALRPAPGARAGRPAAVLGPLDGAAHGPAGALRQRSPPQRCW